MELVKYLFYSVIGKHAGKSTEEIIKDKAKEIDNNPEKFSLWSASIDKKSVEQVWALNPDDEVFVLGKISRTARDPVDEDNIISATMMTGPNGRREIPNEIDTTYEDGVDYQAYVVKEYEVLKSPMIIDFGKYETITSKNEIKTFKNRFKCTFFQNVFGKRNDNLDESCEKEIMIIMKLKYPFVVSIK